MKEYSEMRAQALRLNDKMKPLNSCVMGKGTCCAGDTVMTEGDVATVLGAIENDKIADVVKNVALRNASDPERQACPFLGKTKRCLVYDQRPLRCIIWGNGGAPDPISYAATEITARVTGTDVGMAATEIRHHSCEDCIKGVPPSRRYPTQQLVQINEIAEYTDADNYTTIREFVLNNLK